MNKIIQSLMKEIVQIEVSGKNQINGTVIDLGSDIMVLFNGEDFMYIPIKHVHGFRVGRNNEYDIQYPTEFPSIIADENNQELSIIEVLNQAKGNYVELFVTNDKPLHGYIKQIMSNYFEFFSPIYKTMYISMSHLKWLIPYRQNESPYELGDKKLLQTSNDSLASSFETHVENLKDKIVVLNIGSNNSKIGKIKDVQQQIVEIQPARTQSIYINLDHIQTLHQV
ncbi:DUF2642 domain-containing protein [Psychrobacillus glaciei]|uniref:DUF2642 domain-containing protein n=1 Tax=Psychrobacillus glaciei TaxID=2283160 RepID=A0A5J6SK34_9BACI|nr:DUF2642 domain-containing protein [Psychrobacillus glaciei]QFF98270.1 DUF2642 domain-containing protein [Psychrobacillus glaciei]